MTKNKLILSAALLGISMSAQALQFTNVTRGGFSAPQTAAAYDGVNTLVSVGSDGTILSSTFVDDTAWDPTAGSRTNVPGGIALNAITFGSNVFVAGGTEANIYTSDNSGVDWMQGSDAFTSPVSVFGLAFNPASSTGGRFAAVAGTFAASFATNSPPATWTPASISSPLLFESYRDVTANGSNRFALCGVLGTVRISTNGGATWTVSRALDVNAPDLRGITWDGAQTLVSVGDQGTILYNTNNGAGSWLTANSGTGTNLSAVAHTGTEFVAVGAGGTILTSPDGITWSSNTTAGASGNLRGIAVGASGRLSGVVMLVGTNGTIVLGGEPPLPPVSGGDQFICAEEPLPALSVSVASSSYLTVDWYDASSGGTLLLAGSLTYTPASALPGTTNTFFAQTRDLRTGFVSPTRTAVTLTVNATITVTVAPDLLICAGESYALDGSASGGTPGYTYSWTPTNYLDNPTVANAVATPPPGTNITYALEVTDSAACKATNQVTVTVNAVLTASVAPDMLICAGESYALDGSASGGTPGYTYSWTPTDFLDNPTSANAIATPPAGSTNTYTLIVTDSVGCTATNQVTVTVNAILTASVAVDTLICAGESYALNGSASGGTPGYTYSWTPTTFLDDPANANAIATPPSDSTNIYTLIVTDSVGCMATNQVILTVNPLPEPPASLGDVTNCVGVPNPPLVVSNVTAGATVNWYAAPSGGFPLSMGTTSYVPSDTAAGSHTYYAEARNDCLSATRTPVTLVLESCTDVFTITRLGETNVVLEWYGNLYLQSATNMNPPIPWQTVTQGMAGSTNQVTNSIIPPPTNHFFRLSSTNSP